MPAKTRADLLPLTVMYTVEVYRVTEGPVRRSEPHEKDKFTLAGKARSFSVFRFRRYP